MQLGSGGTFWAGNRPRGIAGKTENWQIGAASSPLLLLTCYTGDAAPYLLTYFGFVSFQFAQFSDVLDIGTIYLFGQTPSTLEDARPKNMNSSGSVALDDQRWPVAEFSGVVLALAFVSHFEAHGHSLREYCASTRHCQWPK